MHFVSDRKGAIDGRVLLLGLLTVGVTLITALLKPVPQSLAYHQFADTRRIAGIPNFANVVSNLFFVVVGVIGLLTLRKSVRRTEGPEGGMGSGLEPGLGRGLEPGLEPEPSDGTHRTHSEHRADRRGRISPVFIVIYGLMFLGILLTGFGSAYYHAYPDNDTMVYDRLPMTIVFMTILSATFSEVIDERMGKILLLPLVLMGIGSVLWWIHTEHLGAGDLRWYGLVQYYPVLLIPLVLVVYPSKPVYAATGDHVARATHRGIGLLIGAVSWYVVAKLCETIDRECYVFTGFISGHTFKHLFAALATWLLVRLFVAKHG